MPLFSRLYHPFGYLRKIFPPRGLKYSLLPSPATETFHRCHGEHEADVTLACPINHVLVVDSAILGWSESYSVSGFDVTCPADDSQCTVQTAEVVERCNAFQSCLLQNNEISTKLSTSVPRHCRGHTTNYITIQYICLSGKSDFLRFIYSKEQEDLLRYLMLKLSFAGVEARSRSVTYRSFKPQLGSQGTVIPNREVTVFCKFVGLNSIRATFSGTNISILSYRKC